MDKKIDPNQFIIYSPSVKPSRMTEEIEKDITARRHLNDRDLHHILNNMVEFYDEERSFSELYGKRKSERAGEGLAERMSASDRVEKEKNLSNAKKVNDMNLTKARKYANNDKEWKKEELKYQKSLLDGMMQNPEIKKGLERIINERYSSEELAQLRNKTKDDYGSGLVNNKNEYLFQHLTKKEKDGTITTEERHLLELASAQRVKDLQKKEKKLKEKGQSLPPQEASWLATEGDKYKTPMSKADSELLTQRSQEYACTLLDEKIESGIVRPDSIDDDMLLQLEVRDYPDIESFSGIIFYINKELNELVDKGFIKPDEAGLISQEGEKFVELYREAYPNAKITDIAQLAMDNVRKLAYQTKRDKYVFSGSDHGTRHILEGNMRMADRMIESLGDRVSAKDKVLIHQIIIDHDIGYTVGVAQAKESFEASKDHPIFSTKYIEAKKDYYIEKFGQDGYEMIKDGVLMHSYTKSEYNTEPDPRTGLNKDIIRSITSTVDALGVTAEVKCPAFFRDPQVVKVLQKIQLFADTHGGKVTPEALAMYKDQLRQIADKEPDETRRMGYHDAINNQFNPVTVEMTLGQYTGVLNDITFREKDGHLKPVVIMDISETQAILGNLFGDTASTKAFVKAMEDFGVSKEDIANMARKIKDARSSGTLEEINPELMFESDKAIFKFVPMREMTVEGGSIHKAFEDVQRISVR
ncbi:MAG TPA: hypothetical protein PL110_17925, partial [Candidatus Eremiobacteraeota bacterium]|nr:hypothetical protein [Candidatus Eremiobacteraeota bacterium]